MNIWDFSNSNSPSVSVGGLLPVPVFKENLVSFSPQVLSVFLPVRIRLGEEILHN